MGTANDSYSVTIGDEVHLFPAPNQVCTFLIDFYGLDKRPTTYLHLYDMITSNDELVNEDMALTIKRIK